MLEKQKEQNKGTVEKTAALQVRNVQVLYGVKFCSGKL